MIANSFLNNYCNYSKNLFSNIILLVPLIILYETIYILKFYNKEYSIRNTADIILRDIYEYFFYNSISYYSFLFLILFLFFMFFYFNNKNNFIFNIKYNYFMYLEGVLFGLILVFILNGTDSFNNISSNYYNDIFLTFYLCLGAGIWEEILFRFLLFSFLYIILSKLLKSTSPCSPSRKTP